MAGILRRHGEELLPRIAVELHGRVVDREEAEGAVLEDPHRPRAAVEFPLLQLAKYLECGGGNAPWNRVVRPRLSGAARPRARLTTRETDLMAHCFASPSLTASFYQQKSVSLSVSGKRGQDMAGSISRRIAAAALAAYAALPAAAQNYPERPVRVIIGFSAGSGVDISARLIGQKLNESWGQPVIADNRPGAGGTIGAQIAAGAHPD